LILTGKAISKARGRGEILIEPFDISNVNPNSYNFHLSPSLIVASPNKRPTARCQPIVIDKGGYVLCPGCLYIGCTVEMIGSPIFAMTLLGRSSLGRLGLFLDITADLGHAGSASEWTLELTVVQPLRIYPLMSIGQVAFWRPLGPITPYSGLYHRDRGPYPNKDRTLEGTEITQTEGATS
jgi:dCTP deaminase